MNILALDQATTTGYAVVTDNGEVITSGVWHLADKNRSGESRGMRYLRFRNLLMDTLLLHDVHLICHEQTLLRGGAATEVANALKGLILLAAEEMHVEVTSVHPPELKKFATGNGRAEKADMINAARTLGNRPVSDDNEADAILIGLWAASIYGAFPAPEWGNKKKAPKRRGKREGA